MLYFSVIEVDLKTECCHPCKNARIFIFKRKTNPKLYTESTKERTVSAETKNNI